MEKRTRKYSLIALMGVALASALFPAFNPPELPDACSQEVLHRQRGYSFIYPYITDPNSAYAPYFLDWQEYYRSYYQQDTIQKIANLEEWNERFCGYSSLGEVEDIVYKASDAELRALHQSAETPTNKPPLPSRIADNTFALSIATSSCTEVTSYLIFARACEFYVVRRAPLQAVPEMLRLIQEGERMFEGYQSYFLKLRLAYQMIRLAHYAGQPEMAIRLYNRLIDNRIDKKTLGSSIVTGWTLGHLAGALQQMGNYPEAAWRFSLVFRNCPSKRRQAYNSIYFRNDEDWKAALHLCRDDKERSTLYLIRAAKSPTMEAAELQTIYELDPGNPQLEYPFIRAVQDMEKIFLRTRVTDQKANIKDGVQIREKRAPALLDLQKLARRVIRENQVYNPKLWRALNGYLQLLAGDSYGAEMTWNRLEADLKKRDDYDKQLRKQMDQWRMLLRIMQLDPAKTFIDAEAYRLMEEDVFKENPDFQFFLEDWLASAYIANQRPGKALLAAYPPEAIGYNPDMAVIDDLLALTEEENPVMLEKVMQIDTNVDRVKAILLEYKGAALLGRGEVEGAYSVMDKISEVEKAKMKKFAPFRENFSELVHTNVGAADSLQLSRFEIAKMLIDYEFRAKASESTGKKQDAAIYYYFMGLAHYNMSYFGYAWEAVDFYRSGYNWGRLQQGPVFSLPGSPDGNKEYTDVSLALQYFNKAYEIAETRELSARALFMAARCQQKQWFCNKDNQYHYKGTQDQLIPVLPQQYMGFYNVLNKKYADTRFYEQAIQECKWLALYAK